MNIVKERAGKRLGTLPTPILGAGLVALGTLAGCGGGSSGGGGGTGTANLGSLSGNVRSTATVPAPGSGGLAGVTVSVGDAYAVSDSNGNFIIPSVGTLPTGQVAVHIDGSTAGAMGQYPALEVFVPLAAGTTQLSMPQIITLPDLMNPASANQTVMVDAMTGATTEAIAVTGGASDIALDGPTGTIITIGGTPAGADVALNVTPVPPSEVPMPLPDGLTAGSFVTVQPGNGTFDPPGAATGLDITLPNALDLAVGTMVDIWSFDHDAGAWVNRSQETGNQGIVVDVGPGPGITEIQATGVITEGGWHAPVITVDTDCATTLEGFVRDSVSSDGIPGASVLLSTGQFATTNSAGFFSVPSVNAYDEATLAAGGGCFAEDLDYEVVVPPAFGSGSSGTLTEMAGSIVTGGTTTVADVLFTPSTNGSVAGIVNGEGATMGEQVYFTQQFPAVGYSVTPNDDGSFFLSGLPEGDWIASYQFLGPIDPTEVEFTITANEISTVTLQFGGGTGSRDIDVLVMYSDENETTPLTAVSGAVVTFQGTDSGSMNGLTMTTDAFGLASFENVDGPFNVTAQKDYLLQGDTVRIASSLIGINPPANTIGVLLQVESEPPPATLDSTLQGTVANMPTVSGSQALQVHAIATDLMGNLFQGQTNVDPMTGNFSMPIPRDVDLDAAVVYSDFAATSQVLNTQLLPGIGYASGPSWTITLNPDLGGSDFVAWDQAVPLTINGEGGSSPNMRVELELDDFDNGIEYGFTLYDGSAVGFTMNLPDVSDAAFAPYRVGAFGDVFEFPSFQFDQFAGSWFTATPASLTFEFMSVPSFIVPFDGAGYTVSEFNDLTVDFMFDSSPVWGDMGINGFSFANDVSGPARGGPNYADWTIFLAPTVTSFDIPPTALPMFAQGDTVEAEIFLARFAGVNFGYDAFFSGDLAENLDMVNNDTTSESEAADVITFTIDFPK